MPPRTGKSPRRKRITVCVTRFLFRILTGWQVVRSSPVRFIGLLQEKGAVFEEVYGHERPRWFAREGVAQQDHYSFRRNIVHELVSAEVKAVCEAAGIMDITAFTKIEVCGRDAATLLDRLVANHLPRRDGGIALTHMLNEAGRIELETTLIRLAEDRFYLVCAAFFEQRLLDHLDKYREGMAVDIILRF